MLSCLYIGVELGPVGAVSSFDGYLSLRFMYINCYYRVIKNLCNTFHSTLGIILTKQNYSRRAQNFWGNYTHGVVFRHVYEESRWHSYYGKFGVFMLGLFSGYYVLCGGDPES